MTAGKSGPEPIELRVDLPGIVEIFGDSLYEDFGSIVRELVQNGHDAIISHVVAERGDENDLGRHRIDVLYRYADQTLIVRDDGTGMSRTELARSLSTFAQSAKRALRQQINDADDDSFGLLQIIGEYGVGFLAAMAVSDEVQLVTIGSGSKTGSCWRYSSGADEALIEDISRTRYNNLLQEHDLPKQDHGTVVICALRDDIVDTYEVDDEVIQEELQKYVTLLPVPVFVNDEQISCKHPAWNNPATAEEEDWRYVIEETTEETPLAVIPIYSPPDELDLAGTLWIPQRSRYYLEGVDVYVKRMFVCTDDHVAIPAWARFVQGTINSNRLRRIVSGNAIKDDAEARRARNYLRDEIIGAFTRWRNLPDRDYHRIIGPHDDAIKGVAADDNEFLECVWDKLRFSIRSKKTTLSNYLRLVRRRTGVENLIYFNDSKNGSFQTDLIADATGIPILDLTQTRDNAIVRRLAELRGWQLRSVKELAAEHFDTPRADDAWDRLVYACAESNIFAEVKKFSPDYLPAVMLADDGLQDRGEHLLEGLREYGEEHFARDLEALFSKARSANWSSAFYLNAANSLIQDLAVADFSTQVSVTRALFNISYMSAMPDLKADEQRKVFKSITDVLGKLLREASRPPAQPSVAGAWPTNNGQSIRPQSTDGTVSVFVMMPFSDEYRTFEQALRNVLEGHPYYFRTILARDRQHATYLIENLRSHIQAADAFVAETSDLNPNVLMELGGVLFAIENPPIFAFRRRNQSMDLPVDIRGVLHVNYTGADNIIALETSIRQAFEKNGRPAHKGMDTLLEKRRFRALTSRALGELQMRLNDDDMKALLGSYETIEDFLNTAPEDVEKRTKIGAKYVEAVQSEFAQKIGR